MRRRGAGKCDFAHGGIELRVRANKRDRWGRHVGAGGGGVNLDASGGEDTLGAARSIGRIRIENGERDGAGSAAIAGARGGAVGSAGAGAGGTRQGKRTKGGGAQGGDGAVGVSGGVYQGRPRGSTAAATGDPNAPGINGTGPYQHGATSDSRSPRGRGKKSDGVAANGDASLNNGPVTVMATGAARLHSHRS